MVRKFNLLDYNEVCEESIMFALVAKEVVEKSLEEPPKKVREVLKEFIDVFPLNYLMSYPLYMTFNTP
jgi:hypothetical protein